MMRISNLTEHKLGKIWQLSENYLHICSKSYKIFCVDKNEIAKIQLIRDTSSSKHSFLKTLLKIASYATIVLPVIAWIVRTHHRNKYKIEINTLQNINDLTKYAKGVDLTPIAKGSKQRNFLEPLITKYSHHDESKKLNNYKFDLKTVKKYLSSKADYAKNIESILEIYYITLLKISRTPSDHDLEMASNLYDLLSKFLVEEFDVRNQQDENCLDYAAAMKVSKNKHVPQASAADIWDILKELKKQLLLKSPKNLKVTKEKIRKINPQSDDSEILKAIECLSMTWLHGSKLNVINRACANTDGNLVPTGLLQKMKVTVVSGEMSRGASELGVNNKFLSGVGLGTADLAIRYANKYKFNPDSHRKNLSTFLSLSLSESIRNWSHYNLIVNSLTNFDIRLSSLTHSIAVLAAFDPKLIEENKNAINKKINSIKTEIEQVLKKINEHGQSEELIGRSLPSLSCSIRVLERLSLTINESLPKPLSDDEKKELKHQIPVVFGSNNQYGIPTFHSCQHHPREILYPGSLSLGTDITHIFVKKNDVAKAKEVLNQNNLNDKIKIYTMETLKLAHKINKELIDFLYNFTSEKNPLPV